ncbi:hypothetical protein TNIN_456401 [Trichonephila inaurata madagascariensis]|uniref:Uncharacterized protein n=1 Tax=Trichonephila inaurata madagascariensis TaxID=2747483 RepID=A0A8X6XCJ9_9ARAC|nr:hypothetical protein TNIN_456401 [Trichonephila inaurata madagascariensis]
MEMRSYSDFDPLILRKVRIGLNGGRENEESHPLFKVTELHNTLRFFFFQNLDVEISADVVKDSSFWEGVDRLSKHFGVIDCFIRRIHRSLRLEGRFLEPLTSLSQDKIDLPTRLNGPVSKSSQNISKNAYQENYWAEK